jgi:hypothetical protein
MPARDMLLDSLSLEERGGWGGFHNPSHFSLLLLQAVVNMSRGLSVFVGILRCSNIRLQAPRDPWVILCDAKIVVTTEAEDPVFVMVRHRPLPFGWYTCSNGLYFVQGRAVRLLDGCEVGEGFVRSSYAFLIDADTVSGKIDYFV